MEPPATSSEITSPWPNLQPDILSTIATLLGPKIGTLRLRSVCKPWRNSLSLSSSAPSSPSPLHFPLTLPSPLSSPNALPLTLAHNTLFLLNNTFLLKLHQNAATTTATTSSSANTFSLLNPLHSHPKNPIIPLSPLNLLDHGITFICESYVLVNTELFKKVVVARDFAAKGDFVVLGLTGKGGLFLWKYGDENWTELSSGRRVFDDIISYKGKFYATADGKGRLVMIDYRLKVIDMVSNLMFGCGKYTHLVGSDDLGLYLVEHVWEFGKELEFGVFKLDEKGRFWDYELDLKNCVFFLGDDLNFSLSRKEYGGSVRNVIYFHIDDYGDFVGDESDEDLEYGECTKVFDMKTRTISSLVDREECYKLYWPPVSWFGGVVFTR